MVAKSYLPDRGDLVWIDLSPTRGHEQANIRPALVLSPKVYNQKTDLCVVCPVTSQSKGYPFEVVVNEKKVSGVVLADHVRNLDWKQRNIKFIKTINQSVLQEVTDKLASLVYGLN